MLLKNFIQVENGHNVIKYLHNAGTCLKATFVYSFLLQIENIAPNVILFDKNYATMSIHEAE